MNRGWSLTRDTYNSLQRQGMEPVYSLGNGYLCARGFFEEEQEGLLSHGGVYMTGVFGKARYEPWKGMGRELVNTPNLFAVQIFADGEAVTVTEQVQNFSMTLEMQVPSLCRSYIWTSSTGKRVKLQFERFVSGSDLHVAGQKITITPLDRQMEIKVGLKINANILNLNMVSSEPLPEQPGVKHLHTAFTDDNSIVTEIRGYKDIDIAQGQSVSLNTPQNAMNLQIQSQNCETVFTYTSPANHPCEISKLVYTYTNLDGLDKPIDKVKERLAQSDTYEEKFNEHGQEWARKWYTADIQIDGCEQDQSAVRYNILQLIQSCPEHTSLYSIGARGITGEMYEGCAFWDTEIFMLPFFTFTNPKAAYNLLAFRHHILPESKIHAQNNYFKGAMYSWQASETGIEQTPYGVGAFYSIHIVADIAYAIQEYWSATWDKEFILQFGAEILIETARFWASRVHKNPFSKKYDLLAVRGPNEYDVIVNNNLYTNMMAQQNLILAIKLIHMMESEFLTQWKELQGKINFEYEEIECWQEIIDHIVIPYNKEMDLYEEDDMYLSRVPLDLKKMKTSLKRVIDTTIPYEALMLYQITKQADVLHVMKNLHWRFTKQQKINAWNYYLPKTCFDSSLSYSMHSVMASQIGLFDEGYRYFEICSNFDVRDMQLNTISGLHLANFGGTWQAVVFGFAGFRVHDTHIAFSPHLPQKWNRLCFKLWYQNNLLQVSIDANMTVLDLIESTGKDVKVQLFDKNITLNEAHKKYVFTASMREKNETI